MVRTYIYLISGKSRNGKDEFYKLGKPVVNWQQVSFAEKLKQTVMDLYGFSYDQMYGNSKDNEDFRYPNMIDSEEVIDYDRYPDPEFTFSIGGSLKEMMIKNPEYRKFLTPRRVLQVFGQDQRRIYPDIWAAYVFRSVIPSLKLEGKSKFIVTDLRFKNEINVAEKYVTEDTVLTKIRIIRPGVFAQTGSSDISEVDLDEYNEWDYVVINDGSLDDLKHKALSVVEDVERKNTI